MTKEQVKHILEENNISVKKHFGQNFLLDTNVLEKIVHSSKITNQVGIVEIGPGLGSLTTYLSKAATKVLCYEIDQEMVEQLQKQNYPNVTIIHDDFLKRDICHDLEEHFGNKDVYVIANLPYYITTPILLKVLEETATVKKMIVMMQKEVAKRICGKPSTKDYNSLSVLIQYFTTPKLLFDVSPNSFYPSPLVDSSVVEIEYKEKIDHPAFNKEYFLNFNRAIFARRRKTLLNNLQKAYPYDKEAIVQILKQKNIKEDIRSEALSVEQIIDLANLFYQTFEKTMDQKR